MERDELHSKPEMKLIDCWNAYVDRLLTMKPIEIIGKAAEIAAARFCYDELTENAAAYPDLFLEYLLGANDPLEVIREQWILQRPHRVAVQNLIVHRRSMRLLHDLGWRNRAGTTAAIWNTLCGRCGITNCSLKICL